MVSGVTSTDTRVIEIDPDDPMNPRTIVAGPGTAYGNVQLGSDGKLYQTSYTSDTTYLAVIDPASSAPPTIVTVANGIPNRNLYKASDGNFYIHTYTGTSASGYTSQVERIDLANPTNVKTFSTGPGISATSVSFGTDGKMYVSTDANINESTDIVRVAQINPNDPLNPTIYLAGTGSPNGSVQIAPNGTMYQQIYKYNSSSSYAVAVLNTQNPNSPTVVALNGSSFATGFGSDGTGAFGTYTYTTGPNNTTLYNQYITVIHPQDLTHPTTVSIGQNNGYFNGSIDVGPDGTAYYTRGDYNLTTRYYENYRTTTVKTNGTVSTFQLPQGTNRQLLQLHARCLRHRRHSLPGQSDVHGIGVRLQRQRHRPRQRRECDVDPAARRPRRQHHCRQDRHHLRCAAVDRHEFGELPNADPGVHRRRPLPPHHGQPDRASIDATGLLKVTGDDYINGWAFILTDVGNGTLYMNVLSWEDPTHPIRSAPQGTPCGRLPEGPGREVLPDHPKDGFGDVVHVCHGCRPGIPLQLCHDHGGTWCAEVTSPARTRRQAVPAQRNVDDRLRRGDQPGDAGEPHDRQRRGPRCRQHLAIRLQRRGVSHDIHDWVTRHRHHQAGADQSEQPRQSDDRHARRRLSVRICGLATGRHHRPVVLQHERGERTNPVHQLRRRHQTEQLHQSRDRHAARAGDHRGSFDLRLGRHRVRTSRSVIGTVFTNYVTVIDLAAPTQAKNVTLPGQVEQQCGSGLQHGRDGICVQSEWERGRPTPTTSRRSTRTIR